MKKVEKINMPCQTCGKVRMIDRFKFSFEKYIKRSPSCHKCAVQIPDVRKKISKGWFPKGMTPWSKGKQLKEIKDYSSDLSSLHKWLRRHWGSPNECEKCYSDVNVQWANKSGDYLRVKNDWLQLCIKCHQRYDYTKFGLRKKFYESSHV